MSDWEVVDHQPMTGTDVPNQWGIVGSEPDKTITAQKIKSSGLMDVLKSIPSEFTRSIGGLGDLVANYATPRNAFIKSGQATAEDLPLPSEVLNKLVNSVSGGYHTPETKVGKYAGAIAGFIPAAVAGPEGFLPRVASVVFPALGSEFLGQQTEGTSMEPWARVLGAVGGSGIAGLGERAPALVRTMNAAAAPFHSPEPSTAETASRILNEMAGSGKVQFPPSPLPGMQLTAGQSSNNPGLLSLERTLQQRNAAGGGDAMLAEKAREAANNSAIRGAVGNIGNQSTDAAQAMSDALDRAYAARKAANSAIWKTADVANTGGVSGFQFNNYMGKYIGGLPIADREVIPSDVSNIMQKMANEKTQNLSDVQSVRSMIGGKAAMAARAGDNNTYRILKGLGDQVESFIEMKAANLGEKFPQYNAARADTRDMKQIFNTPPSVRNVLGSDSFGADKVPVSATVDKFIHARAGAPEDFQAYLKAIGTDTAGQQAARDAFAQKFLDHIQTTIPDQAGERGLSASKTTKFLDDYGHVVNSKLFTQSQRDLMSSIQDAANASARTARAIPKGGPDTAAKLIGNKYLDVLIGPGAAKLLRVAEVGGGALAGHVVGGPIGSIAGALGAHGGGGLLERTLYAAPRERVIDLLQSAINDPEIAKALLMRARPGNASFIPKSTTDKIMRILAPPLAATAIAVGQN